MWNGLPTDPKPDYPGIQPVNRNSDSGSIIQLTRVNQDQQQHPQQQQQEEVQKELNHIQEFRNEHSYLSQAKKVKNKYDVNDQDQLLRNARENEATTGSNVIPDDVINHNRKGYTPFKPHGDGVIPQVLVDREQDGTVVEAEEVKVNSDVDLDEQASHPHPNPNHILRAFIEKIDFDSWWDTKPLPVRETAKASQLELHEFPQLNSCSKLIEQWPMQEHNFPGNYDTFLPWIHDVFPTHDGKYIQFVAQNRRRCHTGKTHNERRILAWNNPQASLFQHVPIKRVSTQDNINNNAQEARYKLTNHENADADGIATRFICRFKPSMIETLSVFNFDYDWATLRKNEKKTFLPFDGGVKAIHTSQLLFKCPVPKELQSIVKSGNSVGNDDYATLFVDLVPIRTPPRYGKPQRFFQPKYKDSVKDQYRIDMNDTVDGFNPGTEFGSNHILPRIEDSGRWENIPICKTSLDTYHSTPNQFDDDEQIHQYKQKDKDEISEEKEYSKQETDDKPIRKHRLAACVWASAGYATRGNRFAINDGQRRLIEWISMNKLTGFDHFYIYDNSMAFADISSSSHDSNTPSLKPVTDMIGSELTTYINWPAQVCNNNPNNVDSPGERSSQYAAESSCRLRFGPHLDWIGQFDVDEYLVPMKEYDSLLPLLDKLDSQKTKIISFGSYRAWPRKDLIEKPVPIYDQHDCLSREDGISCFQLKVPLDKTMLQTYNCDRQSFSTGKVMQMPAEKQLYRPDYVLQHFIHYSAVTVLSDMNINEWRKFTRTNRPYYNKAAATFHARAFPDPLSRFGDELNEATMLHTKSIATSDTTDWNSACKGIGNYTCRIGVPHDGLVEDKDNMIDQQGWVKNCFINPTIENYWVPKLEKELHKYNFQGG